MAVVNDYVDSKVAAGKPGNPANVMSGKLFGFSCTWEVAAADGDGSVYRVARLPANLIPVSLTLMADDSIDITYVDIGLYTPGAGGAVVDIDCFADNLATNGDNLDSADLAPNGMVSMPIDDIGKKLWEIAAVKAAGSYTDANHPAEFDLAVTAKSEPGAAGTFSMKGLFLQG